MVALRQSLAAEVARPAFLRPQDVVLTLAGTLGCALLVFARQRPEGWAHAATMFALIAAAPTAFRALQYRWPNELTRALATFVPPTVGIILFYSNLNPLCDLLNPGLADARLAAIDVRIFGGNPGLWLERHLPAAVLDALFVCYTSYYVWPVSIGAILFFQGPRRVADFDRYILGYVVLMLTSYVGYLAVPAIGPRFYLITEYAGPIQSTAFGRWFEALFRGAPYFRDCFPSGHTALTLYALFQARRLTPRWFKVMLLPAIGLITATVACRFHYGVDLICGALLTLATLAVVDLLHAPARERVPARAVAHAR